MFPRSIPVFLSFVIFASVPASAAPAPDSLKGRTITIAWTENRQEKFDSLDSPMVSVTVSFRLQVYVSETGRAFTRMSRTTSSGQGRRARNHSADQSPVDKNSLGSAGEATFSGQQLTVTRKWGSGARQVSAAFESSFSSCRARIVVGKEGGSGYLKGKSMSGRTEYLFSSSVSGETCSIAAGNAFGN